MAMAIGELKRAKIRVLWPSEQQDFTPWLAQEANIARLAAEVGLELEVENTEVAVGPYSADILARDVGTGRYVVIENQFGKTNHDHLGKLILYGSAFDAMAVIWIAEDFSEEHRKAIEWLNDRTTEELSLYAVSLELWQIDDSKPAVKFNVVSRPNEIQRQATAAKAAGTLSDARKLQLEFWTQFRSRLLDKKIVSSVQAARPQYWFNIPLGRAYIHISATANTWDGRVGVRVYLSNKVADAALKQLERQRAEIESEIGEKLQWNPFPDKKDKIIVVYRPADLDDRSKWPEYLGWLIDRVGKFKRAFGPRVKALALTTDESPVNAS